MERDITKDDPNHSRQKKGIGGNVMLGIILSCWLLFYVYMGSQGGG